MKRNLKRFVKKNNLYTPSLPKDYNIEKSKPEGFLLPADYPQK